MKDQTEDAASSLRLPAAAGVLAGLLMLAAGLAIVAKEDVSPRETMRDALLAPIEVVAPDRHLPHSKHHSHPYGPSSVAGSAPASNESRLSSAPPTLPTTDPGSARGSVGAGESPAAARVTTPYPGQDSTVTMRLPGTSPARSGATPLGSDVWSPILDGASGSRPVAEMQDLLG